MMSTQRTTQGRLTAKEEKLLDALRELADVIHKEVAGDGPADKELFNDLTELGPKLNSLGYLLYASENSDSYEGYYAGVILDMKEQLIYFFSIHDEEIDSVLEVVLRLSANSYRERGLQLVKEITYLPSQRKVDVKEVKA